MTTLVRRIGAISSTVGPVALVGFLWQIRPPLPALSTTVVTSRAEQDFGFLAWLGLMVVALELLDRAASLGTRRQQPKPVMLPRLRPVEPRTPTAFGGVGGYARVAFPIIVRGTLSVRGSFSPDAETVSGVAEQGRGDRFNARPAIEPAQPDCAPPKSAPSDRLEPPAISLLGPVAITGTRQDRRGLRSQTRELLCYLALHPYGAHRDELIEAIWPNQPSQRARNELSRAGTDARKHLGEAILSRERDRHELNRAQITIDLDQLRTVEALISETDDANGRLTLLESALSLFRGEPLAGTDYAWADGEIRCLHLARLDLIEQASLARLEAADPSGAVARAEQGIAIDPGNENLARIAMRAEAAIGQRAAVVARYEGLSRVLDEQLGLRPSAETRTLYLELLGQDSGESELVQRRRLCPVDAPSDDP